MPTLQQLIIDPVSIASFATYALLLAWETIAPARALPRVAGWHVRGVLSFAAFFLVASYLPLLVRVAPLFDATELGIVGGVIALFGYELLVYGYHRALHGSDLLFRVFHQLHHSAERLDVSGAFWFSPFDMVGFTLVATLALSVMGMTPGAITLFVLITNLLSIFQHANVRTPRWLGYLVQRPESHAHHHARGVHRDNYADLPVIDMLFGTFVNPADFAPEQGYYLGASARMRDMLLLRDVTRPPALRASGAAPRTCADTARA
ncbi:MAG TPA: sterol desaturase family protein [Polyangiales bacterium]|nr:sterol desaturase family protein [Polyangiales bacterium]